jgi:hypothetical protein
MGNRFINKKWLAGLLMAFSLTGCGDDGGNSNQNSAASQGSTVTGAVSTEAAAVQLGSAGNYAILAKAGVKTIPDSVVTGNVGVSPIARVGLTGWSLITEPTDTYFTSAQVKTGKLYAADNVGGTTTPDLTTAIANMETAYTAATAKTTTSAATTNIGTPPGTLTNLTLTPGVYEWGSAVNIPENITFSGTATDVWVLKISGSVTMAAAKNVNLIGGALAKNIFWQVSGAVSIGATTHFEGIVLGKTEITFGNKASIKGRLYSQTAVNLDATTVTVP